MAKELETFEGCTVDYIEHANEVVIVLPFEGVEKDRIVARTSMAKGTDPQTIYEICKRDVLFEAAYQAAPKKRTTKDGKQVIEEPDDHWYPLYQAAHKVVRYGQIMRPHEAGQMDAQEAAARLMKAGYAVMLDDDGHVHVLPERKS